MVLLLFSLGASLFALMPMASEEIRASVEKIYKDENAITYSLSGGRFGDNLIAYLHARWLSFKHNTLFIYAPFPYSEHLKLHDETLHVQNMIGLYKKKWIFRSEKDFSLLPSSTLIVVPYFPESELELTGNASFWPYQFPVDWRDAKFKQLIRSLISPRNTLATLEMPKEPCTTVAVHVRKGGNIDPAGSDMALPLKLPPDSFYIAAIQKMSELCSHQKMYVYIFTDDLDPPKIMNKYKEGLKDLKHIDFDCRMQNNGPGANVLEDFFSIQKFDCLIRPDSNYTIVAEKLKDFRIVIRPKDHHIENGIVYIDSFHVEKSF
jgi:hypothetical protein